MTRISGFGEVELAAHQARVKSSNVSGESVKSAAAGARSSNMAASTSAVALNSRDPAPQKRNKYNNIPTEGNGEIFESRKEARQYSKLLLRQGSGQISGLQRQVPYPMVINGVHVCDYIADWTFYEGGTLIVGDAKGHRTSVYKLKKRLMLAVHGLEITES